MNACRTRENYAQVKRSVVADDRSDAHNGRARPREGWLGHPATDVA